MRYPTDPKFLWKETEKAYGIMCAECKSGSAPSETKFVDIEKATLAYRKQRRHTKVQTRKMTRRLLLLFRKILKEIRRMVREHTVADKLLTIKYKNNI